MAIYKSRWLKYLKVIPTIFVLLFIVLIFPGNVDAAKKVEYINTRVFESSEWDRGLSIVADSQNNIYTTGNFGGTLDFDFTGGTDNHTSNGSSDVYITKINSDGSYGWTKTFGGVGEDVGSIITKDKQDNLYVSGWFNNTVDFDFGGGTDNHTSLSGDDFFVIKLDNKGTYIWSVANGGTGNDGIDSIVTDSYQNIYIAGFFENTIDFDFTVGTDNKSSNGGYDYYLTKINSDKTYGYTYTLGNTGYDWANSLAVDNNDNIFVTGIYNGVVDFDFTGGTDNYKAGVNGSAFLTKVNADGTYGGTTNYSSSNAITTGQLKISKTGNIYITGTFTGTVDFDFTGNTDYKTSNGSFDIFITKINSDFTYGWTKNIGGSNQEVYSIVLDDYENLYMVGWFDGTLDFDPGLDVVNRTQTSVNYNGFTFSLDKNGLFRWVKTFKIDDGYTVRGIELANNKLYVTGDFGINTDFNPDGTPDNWTTDGNWSAFLTAYQLYSPTLSVTESSGTTSIVPNVSTDTVTVKLEAEPNSEVIVTLGSSDGSLVYSPSTLAFKSADYLTPQTVTISSATPVGANTTKNMTFKVTSSDTDYNGINVTPLNVGVNVDNSDTTSPNKVVITNIGLISNIPNKDLLKYFFTSQTPTIKGTSEVNSTVYFVVNGHTYVTTTGLNGKYSINLSNPSLERGKNVIVYYAKDSYFNKSLERTLELTVGEEYFPSSSSSSTSSSSSSSSESSLTSSSSFSSASSTSSSSISSSTSSKEIVETKKEITIKDEYGNLLINTKVTINGKVYTTDSKGKVKADVSGIYLVEHEKNGLKYSATLKGSDGVAYLKLSTTTVDILPKIVVIFFVLLVIFIILILRRKKRQSIS